ncbi:MULTISPECIES: hypothetical protein [unclassified Shinella]|uniref:hypothetical protein n=1 Tax=unclassified Shinella TaxID=2643062 RepID=UPI000A75F471|nr:MULTISPECIES: hypothetical protein [unclassified Shinella]
MVDDAGPIDPPKSYPGRSVTRAAAEGVVGLIPGAGLLTNIYAITHPPIEEVDRRRWEVDMTRRSNTQDELLKSVIAAFLRMKTNNQHAADAQHLSFVRGGMLSTLENIGREGLTPVLKEELQQKLEATAKDVEDLLQGLEAALMSMSDDEKSKDFVDVLHEVVFGTFGKSTIRNDINRLIRSATLGVEEQKRQAMRVCDSIDRFNAGLTKLSSYATASVQL